MATVAEELPEEERLSEGRVPYGFARRHGVVVRQLDPDHAVVAHRRDADPTAFLELRRLLARPLSLESVERDEFDRLLQATYEEHQAIGGFEALEVRTDLSSVA